jgi:AcrR family transcriptional regulator
MGRGVDVDPQRDPSPRDLDVRHRILEAAERLFGTSAYEATTVRRIAEAAGIATGSFYRYFPSKRQLLVELLRHLNEELRSEMRRAIADATDQREIERRGFGAFFRFFARHPYLFRIQRQVEFVAPAAYREYFEELARRYARGAKEAMIRGDVDPRFDPDFVAYAYIGLAHFVAMRWIEWPGGTRLPEDVGEQLSLLLAKALAPPGGDRTAEGGAM